MGKQKAIALALVLGVVLAGCVTGPITPEQQEAKMRLVNRAVDKVLDMAVLYGGGDGGLQLWVTDKPKKARLALDILASAVDVAVIYAVPDNALEVPRRQFKRLKALYENTTGEVY